MARLLVVVVVLASFIALVHGYCFPLKAGETEIDGKTYSYCQLEDEPMKETGESWVDEKNCLRCTCGDPYGQCCAFGFAMTGVMYVKHDGERCKAVKTGAGCMDFKYVKESDPSVDCLATPNPPNIAPGRKET